MKKKLIFIFTLFILTASLFAGSAAEDYEILKSFYETCGTNSTINWNLNDKKMDSWEGITLNGQGRVLTINIDDKNFSGPLPANLYQLEELVYIYLRKNSFTGNIPSKWATFPKLKQLNISHNDLTGPIPTWLGSITTLERIYIGNNGFTGPIPVQLTTLDNLLTLSVYGNNLTGGIPPELGNMTKLERLVILNNDLGGTIPPELGKLTKLKDFWANDCNLTGTIPPELGKLENLESLYLNSNSLKGDIPDSFVNLTNLSQLYIDNNSITNLPKDIETLSPITDLRLGNNKLCNLTDAQKSWGDTYIQSSDANWKETQECQIPDWAFTQTLTTGDVSINQIESVSGGYIMAGNYKDDSLGFHVPILTMVDEHGTVTWQNKYYPSGARKGTQVNSMIETYDGNLMLAGFLTDYNNERKAWIMKVSMEGAEIWSKTYGDSSNGYSGASIVESYTYELGYNYVLSGYKDITGGDNSEISRFRLDANGDVILSYALSHYQYIQKTGSKIVNIGYSSSLCEVNSLYFDSISNKMIQIEKLDPFGSPTGICKVLTGNGSLEFNDVISTSDKEIVILASEDSTIHVIKMDDSLNILWQKQFNWEDSLFTGSSIRENDEGNFVCLARINKAGVTENDDSLFFELDQSGNMVGTANTAFGTPDNDILNAFVEHLSGGYVAAGNKINIGELEVVKTRADKTIPPLNYTVNPVVEINDPLSTVPPNYNPNPIEVTSSSIDVDVTNLNIPQHQLIE